MGFEFWKRKEIKEEKGPFRQAQRTESEHRAKSDQRLKNKETNLTNVRNNIKGHKLTEALFSTETLRMVFGYDFYDILPNPDRIINTLSPADKWKFYEEILADDMVSTCVNKISRGVSALKWEIYQEKTNDEIYNSITDIFNHLASKGIIRNAIKNIVEAYAYGRQFIVVDWDYDGDIQVPVTLEAYPIELFDYNIYGEILINENPASVDFKAAPPYRILNPRNNPTKRNPYGKSLLTQCYWLTFFKKNAMQLLNIFIEKYGMPWNVTKYDRTILKGMYPNDNAETAALNLVQYIRNVVRDGVLAMPKEFESSLESGFTTNANSANYSAVISLCNEGISRIFTGHTATTMAIAGKLGTDQSSNDEYIKVIDDQKESVVETMNQLISWICEINYNIKDLPRFQFYEEKDINQDLALRDAILCEKLGVKLNPSYIVKNYIDDPKDFAMINEQ